jgi:hypothetical protein
VRLDQRLKRLEQRVAPRRCGACGLRLSGGPRPQSMRIEVGRHDGGEWEAPCPACGQRRVIRIDFDRAG